MIKLTKVTFILPAFNEEKSLPLLLDSINTFCPDYEIIVVDNNSTDQTSKIAKKYGIKLLYEYKKGKANAIKKGFRNVDANYVVMLDADNTYDPSDAALLLQPLIDDRADLVLGSRMNGQRDNGSITQFNLIGNQLLSLIASLLYSKTSDVCTGFWVFKKEVIEYILEVGIESEGFELEAEMFAKVNKGNFRIMEMPIKYRRRIDQPKLSSTKDGWKIFLTLFKNRF